MASDDLALEEFSGLSGLPPLDDSGEKSAADLATVFDVPVNISAVLGKAHARRTPPPHRQCRHLGGCPHRKQR